VRRPSASTIIKPPPPERRWWATRQVSRRTMRSRVSRKKAHECYGGLLQLRRTRSDDASKLGVTRHAISAYMLDKYGCRCMYSSGNARTTRIKHLTFVTNVVVFARAACLWSVSRRGSFRKSVFRSGCKVGRRPALLPSPPAPLVRRSTDRRTPRCPSSCVLWFLL